MEGVISILLESVFTILGILIAAFVAWFSPLLKRKLEAMIDKDNSGIIEQVINYGVELAEKELTGESGDIKFKRAMIYTSDMLERYGIDVSYEFLKGAIENGHSRMDREEKIKEVIKG